MLSEIMRHENMFIETAKSVQQKPPQKIAAFYLHEAIIIETDSPIITAPQLSVDTVSESVPKFNIPTESENVNKNSANQSNVDSYVYEQYNDNIENNNGGNIDDSQNTALLARRKVSAANRSGNSIRKQSKNSKKLNSVLGVRNDAKGSIKPRTAGSEG